MSSILCYYLYMDANTPINNVIFKALERAIKPLVRLMLARGITYVTFTDWLKRIYVETAVQDFSLPNKAINDSRVSILTGVHRKDVKRLRETLSDPSNDATPSNINLGSQLVSAWLSLPNYSENNVAKPIPRLKKQGADISFEALAETVTKDVRARALLDELERLGAVVIDEDDMVSLMTEAFIPSKGEEEKTFYLGLGVGDHTSAAVSNVLGAQPAYFDRVLHYNHLSTESIQAIEALSKEHSSKLLQLINTEASQLSTPSQSGDSKRFSLGIYFYHENE
jgi:Family of unknown function (DUF6502)